MLSVIFCSRSKDNPASGLPRLLATAADTLSADERRRVEFLIKFDDDDEGRLSDGELARYPFRVRRFVWSRGEGRHGLHHAQEYLFAQRDPASRFCFFTADDFVMTRPGWAGEILAMRDEFCIVGPHRPPIEFYAPRFEEESAVREWIVSFGALSPVVSTRLVEVCQNLGWQSNVDSWLMALSLALYDQYRVLLWKTMPEFYERTGGWGLGDTPTYNNMEVTGLKGPFNRYWFELVRRQARNLYLNMEHGTD
ncbi:MAG: hypothetical protein ACRC33_03405, partial [Gemmataceae bacterium]